MGLVNLVIVLIISMSFPKNEVYFNITKIA